MIAGLVVRVFEWWMRPSRLRVEIAAATISAPSRCQLADDMDSSRP